jgi:hypothetical protein
MHVTAQILQLVTLALPAKDDTRTIRLSMHSTPAPSSTKDTTMKQPIALFALAMLFAATSEAASWKCKPGSFGTGPASLKVETREVTAEFKGISVRNGACVEYVQGKTVSVKVEGSSEALESLEVAVERGSLVIGEKRNGAWSWGGTTKGPLRLLVTAPSIEALAVAGSGDLYSSTMNVDRLKLSVAGSGDIMVQDLKAASVNVSVAGSGDVRVGGKVQSAKMSVAGSGDIDTTRLEAADASISVAGSGDAKIWVTGSLAVSVAGSGTVAYFGTPQISSRTAGSGTLKRLGDKPTL